MLTSSQIALVQDSFAVLGPKVDRVAARFYSRLFELDPTLRSLFPQDLTPQQCKFAEALSAVVKALSRPGQLIPRAEELGRRHARYGITDAQYEVVGEALLSAINRTLGPQPDVEAAWASLYAVIVAAMKEGGRLPVAAPTPAHQRVGSVQARCPMTGYQPTRPRSSAASW